MAELTVLQFVVALCMSLAALFLFVWAVLSGLFVDVEAIKHKAYRTEVRDDEPAGHD
jgi:cbb3-type cytochrome oxidase maturation protein